MERYLLAHDLGTSGNKATLYTLEGAFVQSAVYHYPLVTGKNNVAEQNADDWWQAVCETTKTLLTNIDPQKVAAVSFSGQMMGCLCVDRDGKPLRPSLIWADMRSTEEEQHLREQIDEYSFYQITGQRISSSYTLTKLMWIQKHEPEVYTRTEKVLNAKDYILYRLTGNFVTEPSDGSGTCLMDLTTHRWSDTLLSLGGIKEDKLPELIPSVERAGTVTREAALQCGLIEGTPVICGGGDGCCAAVGTGVVREGIANCCLGTSSWISTASRTPVMDEGMTGTNFAHIVPGYVMPCGSMQTGGGALSWAVGNLYGAIEGYDAPTKNEIYASVNREVAASPIGAKGLLFLPHLIGERSPRWNDKAKGCFIGLTLGHQRGDLLRAVMEGVGYNLDVILRTFRQSGNRMDELILVGGGARNPIWRQILSDILDLPVLVPNLLEEATSMGAAITAGVGIGAFDSFDVADRFFHIESRNLPNPASAPIYLSKKEQYEEAYASLAPLFERL